MGIPFVFRTPKLSPLKFIVASYGMLAFKFDAQKCLYVCYICRLMSKQKKKKEQNMEAEWERTQIYTLQYMKCLIILCI